MPEQAVYRDGDQILRSPEGRLVRVDPEKAAELLNTGISGKPFAAVSEDEVREAEKLRANQSLGNKAKTVALGAAESIGDAAQTLVRATDNPWAKTALALTPGGLASVAAAEVTKRASKYLGADLVDPSRSLPAQAVGVLGGDERGYAQTVRDLAQANPTAFGAGELAGGVATGLATGGVTAGLGEAAAGGLARAGFGATAARIGGTGLAMAAEGGFYGAAQTETQARLAGKTNGATAEELLQGIGLGALLGGGIGAAGSGAMSALRKLVTRAEQAAPTVAAQEAADQASRKAVAGLEGESVFTKPATPDRIAQFQSTLMGEEHFDTIAKYGAHVDTAEAREGRKLWLGRKNLIEESVPQMVKTIDEMEEAIDAVTTNVRQFQPKVSGVSLMLRESGVDQVAAKRSGFVNARAVQFNLEDIVNEIPVDPSTKGVINRIRRSVKYAEGHLKDLETSEHSAANVYVASDFIKRELQALEKNLQFTATRSQDATAREVAQGALRKIEENVQEPFRLSLESERTWGRAGEAQRAINSKFKPFIDHGERFNRELRVNDGQSVWADGRPVYYADSSKVQSWVEQIGTTRGQTSQEIIRARLKSSEDLLDTIAKYHPLDEIQAAKLQTAKEAYTKLQEQLGKLDKTVSVANQIEGVAEAERRMGTVTAPLGGRVVGAITGAVAAGPMGSVMGGLGVLNRPAAAMAMAEQIRAIADRVGAKTTHEASSWIRSGVVGGVAGKAKAAVAQVARAASGSVERAAPTVRKVAAPTAVTLFQGRHKDLNEAYEKRSEQLLRVQSNPTELYERVASVTGELHSIEPDLAGELVVKAQGAIGYLASKLPAGTIDPTPLDPARKAIVPRLELMKFARIWAAVERPQTVLEDLRRGMATADQVEALRACHPEKYQELRSTVQTELLEAANRGQRVPLAMKQQLDLLLDLGGAGVPAYSPDVADRVLALRAKEAQKQPKPSATRKPPNLTASAALPQDKWPSA